ncbi:triose-phosphate isomerase [Massilia luteola]|uniref:triose-phosphate isomerase n=1 Tax=Massilia luteola TaxID=3081751 RepID=UPI002ACBEAF2|nr:triose-phosphate isomerase [Massilia sp. Gc5]
MGAGLRRKLIVGNWKMNGSRQTVRELLGVIGARSKALGCEVAICPPFVYLDLCDVVLSATGIKLGAQDLSEHANGARTGDVSAAMLTDFRCRYVLLGHSERRASHGECDEAVARKALQAITAGLSPIVCVGETWEERQSDSTHDVLSRQIRVVADVLARSGQLMALTVAYEPVWAIGSGVTATADVAQDAHAFIRRCLAGYSASIAQSVRILYGGSMKPENAAALLAMPDIDGGLIGGASLNAQQFLSIADVATALEAVQ